MVKDEKPDVLEKVLDLKSRGVPNKQIVESLRKEGYNNTDILEAMNQSDIKSAVDLGDEDLGDADLSLDEPVAPKKSSPPRPSGGFSVEDIKDVAETLVEDKWKEVKSSIEDLQKWKKDIGDSLSEMQGKVDALDAGVTALKKGILEKIKSYDEGIEDIGAEIKAMDEVFRKILPTLSSDVKELSAIVGKLKRK